MQFLDVYSKKSVASNEFAIHKNTRGFLSEAPVSLNGL